MSTFLNLTADERKRAFSQVESEKGLQAASVEKDFWVCWTLREVFALPNIGEHLTFKGGTSLSKAWNLIERFSEDIDLIVEKDLLGFSGDNAPENGATPTQRKKRLEKLMEACRKWVQEALQAALAKRLETALGTEGWKLEVNPAKQDGQSLLFHYPSVFEEGTAGYVRPVVEIELGARSDDWPSQVIRIQPYVLEQFSELDPEFDCSIQVLAPERTFWEKACLLHEETFRPPDKPRKEKMARHYYDVWSLLEAGIGDRALENRELFERVAKHRELYFNYSWVDYSTHKPGTFRLVPHDDHLDDWQKDFDAMAGSMIFGKIPSFEEILRSAGEFEKRFNHPPPGRDED